MGVFMVQYTSRTHIKATAAVLLTPRGLAREKEILMQSQYITLTKNHKSIAGQRFGRLIALGPIERNGRGEIVWLCQCDCGQTMTTPAYPLRTGHTKSCGCLYRETRRTAGKKNKTHGMTNSDEYRIWCRMRLRCNDPKATSYPRYGGRGIYVCLRWDSFEAFYKDMGSRPSKNHSIDRVDNDGPYDPSNCVWATAKEQANNRHTRSDAQLLTFEGKTQTAPAWAKELGIGLHMLRSRIRKGWSVERALATPKRGMDNP